MDNYIGQELIEFIKKATTPYHTVAEEKDS